MSYVLALNGPPHSGKDTIANAIIEQIDRDPMFGIATRKLEIKAGLRAMGMAVLGLPNDPAEYDRIKDVPQDIFNGDSLRQWMIGVTEGYFKPRYGKTFWISRELGLNPFFYGLSIVTDMGFDEEINVLYNKYTAHSVLLVHLYRDGTSFFGDSRNYVSHPILSPLAMYNESTPEEAARELINAMLAKGWSL